MNLQSDFALIDDPRKEAHQGWCEFKKAMKGKQYGYEALNDAWAWFKEGWNRSIHTNVDSAPRCNGTIIHSDFIPCPVHDR